MPNQGLTLPPPSKFPRPDPTLDSFDFENSPNVTPSSKSSSKSPKSGLCTRQTLTTILHAEPENVLNTFMGGNSEDVNELSSEVLSITRVQTIKNSVLPENVVRWMFEGDRDGRNCETWIKLKVTKRTDEDIQLEVMAVEKGEIEADSKMRSNSDSGSPTTSNSTLNSGSRENSKTNMLVIENGNITLRPLPFGQTEFTISASVGFPVEQQKFSRNGSSIGMLVSRPPSSAASLKALPTLSSNFGAGPRVEDLFGKISELFYRLFEKEDVIDERMKEEFVKGIGSVREGTEEERVVIGKAVDLIEHIDVKAKRIAGTVSDSVKKSLHHPHGEAGWGMSVARMDIPAMTMFAELWLVDTYAKSADRSSSAIRKITNNVDGTRGMLYSLSVSLPGGFQNRLLEMWYTWEKRTDEDGRRTFIVSYTPMEDYIGTRHKVTGDEKMIRATLRGVYVIKELTDNTCEWTWAQQLDLKINRVMSMNIMDFVIKQQLSWADEEQASNGEKFRRNGKKVDQENREAVAEIMRKRRGKPLMDDQVPVFAMCMALQGDGGGEGWRPLPLPSADVEISIKYFPPEKGERSVLTGKAVGIVDCSMEELAAWCMDYCSNERMRKNKEKEGFSPRVELRHLARVNESTFATVKSVALFLDRREFVFRMIWKSEEGQVFIAVESVDLKVDYGVSFRKTRGFLRYLYHVETLPIRSGVQQCRLTLVQTIDAGGIIPTWDVDKNTRKSLNVVQEVIDEFRQDELVDGAARRELSTYMRECWEDEKYNREEEDLVQRIRQKFVDSLKEDDWKPLRSPDNFVTMESIVHPDKEKASSVLIGRSITVVDASIELCAAWEYLKLQRDKMLYHHNEGGCCRTMVKLNDHSDLYYTAIDFHVPGFAVREWLAKMVWKMLDEDTMVVAVEDVEHEDFPIGAGKNWVRASADAWWKYERLPDIRGIAQTRVTYYQNVDLKGSTPKFIANSKVTTMLGYLSEMRNTFDKSKDVDGRRRAELGRLIKQTAIDEETSENALKKFEELFEERKDCEPPHRNFGMAESKIYASLFGGRVWGRTTVKVRAGLLDVAAFFWDFGSRASMAISSDIERTFQMTFVEGELILKKDIQRRQKLESHVGTHHSDRTFNSVMILSWIDKDTVILVMSPDDQNHDIRGTEKRSQRARGSILEGIGGHGCVKGKENVAIRLKRVGVGKTKLDYACYLEIGMGVSHRSARIFVERRLEEMHSISIYFQRLAPMEVYRSHDGKALGHDILWKAQSSKHRVERLDEVVSENKALKELVEKYPIVKAILAAALMGRLNMNRVVRVKLECISEPEGLQIGNNLIPSLMTEALAEAGVNEWRVNNRAVKELMESYPWFEPMVVTLSRGIVRTAHWGLMWRVVFGALVSMSDLFSDIAVLKQYWEVGESMKTYMNLQLISLSVSLFLQMGIAWIQNIKKSPAVKAKELLIVLCGMKAPWDAYRVAVGGEKDIDSKLDPLTEMTFSKCVEIFAESIPGILIQTAAIINTMEIGGRITKTSMTSLFVSVVATGFVSATISYDLDTDPTRRALCPNYYGYVPDSSTMRPLLFSSLINMSASSVLIKGIFICTLGRIDASYAWYYLGSDMAFFLLMKVLRRDFTYWLPVEGKFAIVIAVLVRVIVKLIADFTGTVQLRHPNEVGGLSFTLNYFVPLIGLSVLLFHAGHMGFAKDSTLNIIKYWTIFLGLWLVFWTFLFFMLMNKEYRKTFYSIVTSKQNAKNLFRDGDDQAKANAFMTHSAIWLPFEDEIQEWLNDGWGHWEDEKPDWFNDDWKHHVPERMKPMMSTMKVRRWSNRIEKKKSLGLSGKGLQVLREGGIKKKMSGGQERKIFFFGGAGGGRRKKRDSQIKPAEEGEEE